MPGVDGLRALAVAAVVAYHAGAGWLPGGFLGVDVFFVISGYLITSLLLAEHRASGSIDLVRFWMRRARRLLPALVVMIAVVLAAMLVLHHDEVGRLRGAVVSSLLYVGNWYLVFADQSYFAEFGRPPVFRHLWSLAVEEQFYLLWPPVLALGLVAIGRKRLLLVVATGIAAATALAWALFDPLVDPSRIYYGTDTRGGGLLVGVALAFVWPASRLGRATREGTPPVLDVVGVAALAGLIGLMAWLGEFDPRLYQGGFLMVAVTTAVLLAVVAHPGSRVGRAFAWGPLVWIGVRSYGIYLWHWPVLVLTRAHHDVPFGGPGLVTLQVALTVGIAALSYRYVETPFRRAGMRGTLLWLRSARGSLQGRTAVAAACVAALAIAIPVALLPADEPAIPGVPRSGTLFVPAALPDTPPPGRVAVPGPVLAVGDSVLAGTGSTLRRALGGRVAVDAEVGRQFDDDARAVAAGLKRVKPKALVLHVGTNGYVPADGLGAHGDVGAHRGHRRLAAPRHRAARGRAREREAGAAATGLRSRVTPHRDDHDDRARDDRELAAGRCDRNSARDRGAEPGDPARHPRRRLGDGRRGERARAGARPGEHRRRGQPPVRPGHRHPARVQGAGEAERHRRRAHGHERRDHAGSHGRDLPDPR
jgi:peptidoglycan/LPS O-acetylase OafA/YrhL